MSSSSINRSVINMTNRRTNNSNLNINASKQSTIQKNPSSKCFLIESSIKSINNKYAKKY